MGGTRKNIGNRNNVEPGIKDARINIRCSVNTKDMLVWIRDHSTVLQGKSDTEIIEQLIWDHCYVQQAMFDMPRFHRRKKGRIQALVEGSHSGLSLK